MSNNNIDININAKVDEKALAASLEAFSSGLIHQQLLDFYDLLTGYKVKYCDLTDTVTTSPGEELIELENGVKFTWEDLKPTGINFWDYIEEQIAKMQEYPCPRYAQHMLFDFPRYRLRLLHFTNQFLVN